MLFFGDRVGWGRRICSPHIGFELSLRSWSWICDDSAFRFLGWWYEIPSCGRFCGKCIEKEEALFQAPMNLGRRREKGKVLLLWVIPVCGSAKSSCRGSLVKSLCPEWNGNVTMNVSRVGAESVFGLSNAWPPVDMPVCFLLLLLLLLLFYWRSGVENT